MRRIRKAWLLMALPFVVAMPAVQELALGYRNLHVRNRVRDEWRAFWRFWNAQ